MYLFFKFKINIYQIIKYHFKANHFNVLDPRPDVNMFKQDLPVMLFGDSEVQVYSICT